MLQMSCSYRNCLFSVLFVGLEFVCPDKLPTGRTKSSDWETRAKLCTPVSVSVLRQRNAPVPHTVGHCHIRRLSFLKSLSADVPEYQRDIEASRSVWCNLNYLIWSETSLYSAMPVTVAPEPAAIDGLVSSWSENAFVLFCLRAPRYGLRLTLWCALGLLVGGTIQVPQLQLQL